MKIICSWCRGEESHGLVGEKPPWDDQWETHSICLEHEKAVRARWSRRRTAVQFYGIPNNGFRDLTCRTRRVVLSAMQLCAGLKGFVSKVRA